MKFMNQQARNWANHYQEEAPEGGDKGGGADPSDPPADNWRDSYLSEKDADGNEIDADTLAKRKNMLERYTSQDQMTDSFFKMKAQISKGLKPAELPKDATEEQIAEYRKSQGLPESADKYEYELPEGLVLSDEDKAITDGLKEVALNNNISPAAMSKVIEANMELREKQMVERSNRDKMLQETSQNSLQERWGDDYEANLNVIENLFVGLKGGDDPEGASMQFQNARAPNGDRIFDNPDMVAFVANLGRRANPESTLSTGDGQGSLGGRMQELEKKMEEGNLTTAERTEWAKLNDMKEGITE